MTAREYVSEQLALILGTPVQPTEAQVTRFWAALSRAEERDAPKDTHGNFPPDASVFACDGQFERPPLHAEIESWQQAVPSAPARWPGGYRFAVCLTHDVDRIVQLPWRERWRQLATLRHAVTAKQALRWAVAGSLYAAACALGRSDLATFDHWVEEERHFGYHSTFFVLPERPVAPTFFDHYYRYADPIRWRGTRLTFAEGARRAQEEGWEIGFHGSYASALDREIFRQEKAQLEDMLDAPVVSARQHFLRFDAERTPQVQAAAGIQADTTLGFSSVIGCRCGLAFPYFWPGEDDLLEVPLLIQDVGLLRVQGTHLDLAHETARARSLLQRIAAVGGVATLSWHTHPESPGAHECYHALLEEIAALNGWGCSLGELNAWWRTRRTRLRHNAENGQQTHPSGASCQNGVYRRAMESG
ncbi:MAG TPA: hypothetical protein VGL77_21200 [Armatimonadota bacterium]|jgi:hypothetical protein